jgi:transposase-like protein
MKRKYSDEFKLEVIKDYYQSQLGVRMVAIKYGLPSKNYITNWEQDLKKKGLLPPDSTKPKKAVGRASEKIVRADNRTEREKQYEAEIEQLKARVAYYEGLDSLQPFLKKTRDPANKVRNGSFVGKGISCWLVVFYCGYQQVSLL